MNGENIITNGIFKGRITKSEIGLNAWVESIMIVNTAVTFKYCNIVISGCEYGFTTHQHKDSD